MDINCVYIVLQLDNQYLYLYTCFLLAELLKKINFEAFNEMILKAASYMKRKFIFSSCIYI